jgi:hypothetical protein
MPCTTGSDHGKWQTRPLIRGRPTSTKPQLAGLRWDLTPRLIGRLTVGRNVPLTLAERKVGPKTKNDCAGEGHRRFTRLKGMRLFLSRTSCSFRNTWSGLGRFRNFLFSTSSRRTLGPTQFYVQWVPWHLSAGVKRPGREDHHSPPASDEVNRTWIYTSTAPYVFMA